MYATVKRAKLYPNKDTQQLLEKTFGCCRLVWNRLLGECRQDRRHYVRCF